MTAVRGNNDGDPWAKDLGETAFVRVADVGVYVVHDVADLRRTPAPSGTRVVVSGHSHKPSVVERDGVLYVNPGSAGPRRFTLPIAVAELVIRWARADARYAARPDVRDDARSQLDARIVELAVAPAGRTR